MFRSICMNQTITLYILNSNNIKCRLHLSKAGGKERIFILKAMAVALWATMTKWRSRILDIDYCPTSGLMPAVLQPLAEPGSSTPRA